MWKIKVSSLPTGTFLTIYCIQTWALDVVYLSTLSIQKAMLFQLNLLGFFSNFQLRLPLRKQFLTTLHVCTAVYVLAFPNYCSFTQLLNWLLMIHSLVSYKIYHYFPAMDLLRLMYFWNTVKTFSSMDMTSLSSFSPICTHERWFTDTSGYPHIGA